MIAAIDWGNTNTVVAFRAKGQVNLFAISDSPLIPSCMHYGEDGQLAAIGVAAQNALKLGKGGVISGIKRLIGRGYSDDDASWADETYGLETRDVAGRLEVLVGGGWKTPEAIATDFFKKLRDYVHEQGRSVTGWLGRMLGRDKIERCVVTCPAHYDTAQKEALRQCVADAGLDLVSQRLLPEPAAACALLEQDSDGQRILVIDWGGGTLDYAIHCGREVNDVGGVKRKHGGIDMDRAIMRGLLASGRVPGNLSPTDTAVLRLHVESAKERLLSGAPGDRISETAHLPSIGKKIGFAFTLEEFRVWTKGLIGGVKRSIQAQIVKQMNDGGVDRCVLIGGPVRSEWLRASIAKAAGNIAVDIIGGRHSRLPAHERVGPMTAVARGALKAVKEPPTSVLEHDYGIMLDQYGINVGKLLLRSGQACPVDSEEREVSLSGSPGMPVKIAVWSREESSAEERHTYHHSYQFTFLPKFDEGTATVRISLSADNAGIVSARVVDGKTRRVLQLSRIGRAMSRPMENAPCRSAGESVGIDLVRHWKRYSSEQELAALLSGSGLPPGLLPAGFVVKSQTPDDYFECVPSPGDVWDYACRLADDSLEFVGDLDGVPPDVTAAANVVGAAAVADPGADVAARGQATVRLAEELQDLYVKLVRWLGGEKVVPSLRGLGPHSSAPELASRADVLERIFEHFTDNHFDELLSVWNEIAARLATSDPACPALAASKPVLAIIELRGRAKNVAHHAFPGRR